MTDLSKLSDAELMQMLQGAQQTAPDLSKVSDEELLAALDGTPDPSIAAYTAQVLSGDPERAGRAVAREEGRRAGQGASIGQTVGAGLQKGTLRNFSDEMAGYADASGLPIGAPPIISAPVGAARVHLLGDKDAETRRQQTQERARGYYEGMTEAHPIASYGSQIAGAVASPAKTPLGIAGEGALFGIGEGEDLQGRATGGAIGAAGGYAVGKIADKIMPGPASAAPNAVVDAATRQGIDVPVAAATNSTTTQRLAQVARNVPLAGDPLVKATGRTVEQLGQRADGLAAGMGGAGMEQAGETASKGVVGWIKGKSGALVKRAYDAVDDLVDGTVTKDLSATRGAVADILAKRQNARLPGDSKAVNQVIDAVQSGGLNYEGVKTLRTTIGEMLDNGILPEGMSARELKQIYGALSDDLKSVVQAAGGNKALARFERANKLNTLVNQRREALASLVGRGGDATPAQVYDRLLAAAGSKSRADTSLLLKARKVVGADDWNEFASAIVGRLGRDADGNFSPDRFATDYGKLSETGKAILFGADKGVRQSLDDIATISARMRDVHKRFGNPSGTSQSVAGGGLVYGLMTEPVTTVSALVGANVFTRIVSRPATASAMARYARAIEVAAKKPTRGALTALEQSAKQFSGKISQELGVSLDPAKLLGGMKPSYAQGENNNGIGVGQ